MWRILAFNFCGSSYEGQPCSLWFNAAVLQNKKEIVKNYNEHNDVTWNDTNYYDDDVDDKHIADYCLQQ